ncbi:MAG: two-component system CAI-1 autoinducer sensor kinase/phosphatase CqsS [Candidatus Midichloriaceae bacterium]
MGLKVRNFLFQLLFGDMKIDDMNNKLNYLLSILIILTYTPIVIYAVVEDSFIIKSLIIFNFLLVILNIVNLLHNVIFKTDSAVVVLRSSIMFFSLPFISYYCLFLSEFDNQWVMKLVLASAILYMFVSQKKFIIYHILSAILAYLVYYFISLRFYEVNISLMMEDDLETYAIFSNGAFSIALLLIMLFKLNYSQNQIEFSKTFANAIAHEVHGPISIAKVKADILMQKIKEEKYEEFSKDVLDIYGITNLCLNNVEVMLITSRNIDTEYSDTKRYSIIKCIEIAIDEHFFLDKQFEKINFDNTNDFYFYGSRLLFKYIIFNLLKNSFSHAGTKADIYIWAKDNKLYFKDTGVGIKSDVIKYIFDMNFTTSKFGIGLYYCKTVLKKMGATVKCTSVYGEYTQFEMTFPVLKQL